jgi:hypothetical protein
LTPRVPPNFPALKLEAPRRWFPKLPVELEKEIVFTLFTETLVNTKREPHKSWWDALRRSPHERPRNVPTLIEIEDPTSCIRFHAGPQP